jgi:hypothetical protein
VQQPIDLSNPISSPTALASVKIYEHATIETPTLGFRRINERHSLLRDLACEMLYETSFWEAR